MAYSTDQTLNYINQALELKGLIDYYESEAKTREDNYSRRFDALIEEATTPPYEPHHPSRKDYAPQLEKRWTVIGHLIERVRAKRDYKAACERYQIRYKEYLAKVKDFESRKGNEDMLSDSLLEEKYNTLRIIKALKKNAAEARSEYSQLMSLNFVKPVYQDPDDKRCIMALACFKHYLELGCSSMDKAYDMYIDEMKELQRTKRRNEYYEKLVALNQERDANFNILLNQQANIEEALKLLTFDSGIRTYFR